MREYSYRRHVEYRCIGCEAALIQHPMNDEIVNIAQGQDIRPVFLIFNEHHRSIQFLERIICLERHNCPTLASRKHDHCAFAEYATLCLLVDRLIERARVENATRWIILIFSCLALPMQYSVVIYVL